MLCRTGFAFRPVIASGQATPVSSERRIAVSNSSSEGVPPMAERTVDGNLKGEAVDRAMHFLPQPSAALYLLMTERATAV